MPNANKQAARNQEIKIASASGENNNQIAARYDLSPARVRQILLQRTEVMADIADSNPVQAALERRAQFETVYEEAMALFDRIPDSNPSAKVGALRLALVALERLATWDQAIGVIPGRLAQVSDQMDARRFFDDILESMRASGASPEMVEKTLEEMVRIRGDL